MLRFTFLFLKSISDMAQSSFSPPVHLFGRASAELIAIFVFLIWKSISQPSGLTINPLLSVDVTLTVIVWLTSLSLNQSKGSFNVWRLFEYVRSLQCKKTSISNSSIFKKSEYSFLFITSPSIIESTGYFFSKVSYGFSFVNLCDIETLLFSLSISVITQSILSPTFKIFLGDWFFLVQLISLEWSKVVKPGSSSQKAPKSIIFTILTL